MILGGLLGIPMHTSKVFILPSWWWGGGSAGMLSSDNFAAHALDAARESAAELGAATSADDSDEFDMLDSSGDECFSTEGDCLASASTEGDCLSASAAAAPGEPRAPEAFRVRLTLTVNRTAVGIAPGLGIADCGVCVFCLDKPRFGGRGTKRQKCVVKQAEAASFMSAVPARAFAALRVVSQAEIDEIESYAAMENPPALAAALAAGPLPVVWAFRRKRRARTLPPAYVLKYHCEGRLSLDHSHLAQSQQQFHRNHRAADGARKRKREAPRRGRPPKPPHALPAPPAVYAPRPVPRRAVLCRAAKPALAPHEEGAPYGRGEVRGPCALASAGAGGRACAAAAQGSQHTEMCSSDEMDDDFGGQHIDAMEFLRPWGPDGSAPQEHAWAAHSAGYDEDHSQHFGAGLVPAAAHSSNRKAPARRGMIVEKRCQAIAILSERGVLPQSAAPLPHDAPLPPPGFASTHRAYYAPSNHDVCSYPAPPLHTMPLQTGVPPLVAASPSTPLSDAPIGGEMEPSMRETLEAMLESLKDRLPPSAFGRVRTLVENVQQHKIVLTRAQFLEEFEAIVSEK